MRRDEARRGKAREHQPSRGKERKGKEKRGEERSIILSQQSTGDSKGLSRHQQPNNNQSKTKIMKMQKTYTNGSMSKYFVAKYWNVMRLKN